MASLSTSASEKETNLCRMLIMEYLCSDHTATTQLIDHLLLYCTGSGKPNELPPLAQFRYVFHKLATAANEPDLWADAEIIAQNLEILRYIARDRDMGQSLSVAGINTELVQPSDLLITLVKRDHGYEQELRKYVAMVKKQLPEPMILNNLRFAMHTAVSGTAVASGSGAGAAPVVATGTAVLSPNALATAARISSPLAQGLHHPQQQRQQQPVYISPGPQRVVQEALLNEAREGFRAVAGRSTIDEALAAAQTIQNLGQQPQQKQQRVAVEEEEEEEHDYYEDEEEEAERRRAALRAKAKKRKPTAIYSENQKTPRPPGAKTAGGRPTPRRERIRFSEAEDAALVRGMQKYENKTGKWREILDENIGVWARASDGSLARTNVDLKDRWRNLVKKMAE